MILLDVLNILVTDLDSLPSIVIADENATDQAAYNILDHLIKDYISDQPLRFGIRNDILYFGSIQFRDIILGIIALIVILPTISSWIADYNKKRDIARNENTERDITYRRLLRQEQEDILEFNERRELVERRMACRRTYIDPDYTKTHLEKRKLPDRRMGTDRRRHGDIYVTVDSQHDEHNNGRRSTDIPST